jgi:uncharacterized protein
MLRAIILRAIRRYQASGGGERLLMVDCNFEPTCSEYTYQAIEQHGLPRGLAMAIRRVRRCSDRDCIERSRDPVPSR